MSDSEVDVLIRTSHGSQGFSWDRELTDLEHLAVLRWHIKRGTFDAVATPHLRDQVTLMENSQDFPANACASQGHYDYRAAV